MDRSRISDGGRIEIYSPAFFTWALGKYGAKAGRVVGIAGAAGAIFPDVPILVGTTANFGPILLREGWGAINPKTFLDAIPATFLHSTVPSLALLST